MRSVLTLAAILLLSVADAGAEEIQQLGSNAVDAHAYAASIQGQNDYFESSSDDYGCGCGDSYGCGDSCGDCCNSCGHHGCTLFSRLSGCLGGCNDGCHGGKGRRRNQNLWENCNCNGSYKFPVPPLYTYHWPGLYSWQLMTDYQSPYRFPAIKPYVDEKLPTAEVTPASFTTSGSVAPIARGGSETVGAKMRRIYGQ